jgi:hypothetical protein
MAMEVAIYSDFERGKAARKKREAEQSQQGPPAAENVAENADEKRDASEVSQGGGKPGVMTVEVLRCCRNPRLVECIYRDERGGEERILVRVKSNAFFKRGMEVEARRPERESEPWIFAGSRLPRFAGRW